MIWVVVYVAIEMMRLMWFPYVENVFLANVAGFLVVSRDGNLVPKPRFVPVDVKKI